MTSNAHQAPERRWAGLYRAAGFAALLTAALIPLQIILFLAWPPPVDGSVTEWFALFMANPLHGLLSLDLLMMLEQVLLVAIIGALYVQLRRASESTMALASVSWLVALTLFIASNTGFEMLALTDAYAAATTDAARAAVVAAGEAMLASYWSMGTSFVFGYVVSSVAGIAAGFAILREGSFGRAAGWTAIGGNLLSLGIFLPVVGIAISLVSVVVLWAWYVLIGLRLVRLARLARTAERPATVPDIAAPAAA